MLKTERGKNDDAEREKEKGREEKGRGEEGERSSVTYLSLCSP